MTQQAPNTTSAMLLRINAIKKQANDSERRNEKYKKEDRNQYYRITDKEAYIKQLIHQVKTGKATGDCKKDHLFAYSKLLADKMSGDTALEDIKLLYYEYHNPNAGENHWAVHYTILVKINNIWYVRDDTNYIQEQRCLYEYFSDRECMDLLTFKEKFMIVSKYEEVNGKINMEVKYVEGKDKNFPIMTYCYHNMIVKNMRGDAKYK